MSGIHSFTYTWKIENFSFNTYRINEAIVSEPFYAVPLLGTSWNLQLYPRGKWRNDRSQKNYISCFLYRSDKSGPQKIKVQFEFSIVGMDGAILLPWKSQYQIFEKGNLSAWGNRTLWNTSQLLKSKKIYFPDDVFTIRCVLFDIKEESIYKSVSNTVIEYEKREFRRSVENVSEFNKPRHCVKMPLPFQNSFEMVVCSGEDEKSEYLSSCIRRDQKKDGKCYVMKGKVTLLDSEKNPKTSVAVDYLFESPDSELKFSFINLKKLQSEKMLVDDTLELLFELFLSDGESASQSKASNEALDIGRNDKQIELLYSLSENLKTARRNEEFSDVTLRCQGKDFRAHRVILAACSPVFRTEFLADFREKKNGVITVEDMDSATIDKLLDFMYFGQVFFENMTEVARLLEASERYQVLPLKSLASTELANNIVLSNVCEILLLSDRYRCYDVKKKALNFIQMHPAEVLESEGWTLLSRCDFRLELEVRRKLQSTY